MLQAAVAAAGHRVVVQVATVAAEAADKPAAVVLEVLVAETHETAAVMDRKLTMTA